MFGKSGLRLRIDPTERRASLDGRPLALSPLLWRLLLLLSGRPGTLVDRAAIKQALWPYAVRIDTGRRLNTAVKALRSALGDDPEAPRFIATVRGGGYRWVAARPATVARPSHGWAAAVAALILLAPIAGSSHSRPAAADPAALLAAQAAVDSWRSAPTPQRLDRARLAVHRAGLAAGQQPSLSVLQAQLALEAAWDWRQAETLYRRALALDPANADARLGLAWLAANRGDRRQAEDLASGLLGGMVASGERRAELGWLLIRIGRPDLAAEACPATAGASLNSLSCAHTALASLGRMEEARRAALGLMAARRADGAAMAQVAALPAPAAYARFLDWRTRHFLPADAPMFQRAQLLADAGRTSEALALLGRSIAAHEPLAVKIASSPSFAAMHGDPRFQAMVRAVGVLA